MLHNADHLTRTAHQTSGTSANRRRALRHKATLHGHRWDGPHGTYHVTVSEPSERVGRIIGPMPAPFYGATVAEPHVAPPSRIGGAPDPTILRTHAQPAYWSPTWQPMVETYRLQRIAWRAYCAAWLATPEGAETYADALLAEVAVSILADRETDAIRKAARKRQTRERVARHRARKVDPDAAPTPVTADDWAASMGVHLPTVDGKRNALEVSRENRVARPSRVPAVDLYGARI